MKKRMKKSAGLVALKTEVIQDPDEAALDEILGLFMQTYEKSETKFERLDRRYFEVFGKIPEAHFVILREPEQNAMVAFMLCLVSGEVVINKFIGLDYARDRDWALYFRLWDVAADWALRLGARALQSGQTGYRPKVELGHQPRGVFEPRRRLGRVAEGDHAEAEIVAHRRVADAVVDPLHHVARLVDVLVHRLRRVDDEDEAGGEVLERRHRVGRLERRPVGGRDRGDLEQLQRVAALGHRLLRREDGRYQSCDRRATRAPANEMGEEIVEIVDQRHWTSR